MRRGCVIFASLLVLAPTAAAAAARPLDPVSKWDLNYGDVDCVAYRNYGSAEQPITLALRPSPNGETYEILVARKRPAPQYAQELEGSVGFGGAPIKAWVLHYRSPSKGVDVYQFRISAAEMAQARTAKAVTLHLEGAPGFAFTLAAAPQLLNGLDECTADLKRYWNMGGETDGRIATPSTGDVRSVFTGDDYPSEAMKHLQEGDGQFLLLVDEKGKVAGCHVLIATGAPALDAMGCVVIEKRAQFKPALDSAGKPVRSTFVTPKVRWRLR